MKYSIDNNEFLDKESNKRLAIIDGGLGTLLVLMSFIDNQRFLGDFIFNV